ncbi:hypothetical protein [Streptomyces sp. AM 3-1-1]|uniref:hypothetical protein n=1 Tax=Streptomyces sp. AM 3-1-1 TaxID=3028711 RepID=UPI0023B9D054|nr:hypothetical protein [Streptomyces sp. AM 3-1-1]WEH27950.1 hypothetical protein P0D76_11760 [Streptomyces sp. AM 3-1-1]
MPLSELPQLDTDISQLRGAVAEALADGGSRHLLRLTDEEIAVLDPNSLQECVAPTPRLAELSEQEREWTYVTALRSLVSREAVDVANIEELDALIRRTEGTPEADRPSDVDLDLRMTTEVSLALTLRRTAERALVAEQHTAGGTTHTVVYGHTPGLYLVERVTGGGLHMFSLAASAADAAEVVRLAVDPFEIADKDGPVRQLTPEQIATQDVGTRLSEVIDTSLVVGQVVRLADVPGPLLTTYATDREVWTVYVERPDAPAGIEARPVGPGTLGTMLQALLALPAPEAEE